MSDLTSRANAPFARALPGSLLTMNGEINLLTLLSLVVAVIAIVKLTKRSGPPNG